MAFAYDAINNGVSVVTAIIGMLDLDAFGRHDITFCGNWIQALFLCLICGLGSKKNSSQAETDGMVASFILYAAALHAILGPAAYITTVETGTAALRDKTMAFATTMNVVVGFVVMFRTPYSLSQPYANLGPKIGYIWGVFAALGPVWVWFCMPELKGRNLEEIDQFFDSGVPAREFPSFQTAGKSHEQAFLECGYAKAGEAAIEHVDEIECSGPNRSACSQWLRWTLRR
ncbi:uncharacterized protein A1O9_07904 [Exophiala aquamarina CBS 119918]|uniref:Major facilitator superfamily (MFS) profile domain-containing protein n=1 Tax=Exophiala aquamarina CBS 119918 TaxID=1182545 RepID=A0A072PAP2_9EURO|nr:uncharacterized protein A1O9_07904 [Exophiala aquamarina CBS 119918]KEF56323.1 hypothetical protein A1O9_07904 [Exophiala aquamarina CBS 119918]